MSCCERKCNMCYFGIIISLILILLLWNIVLTISITIINENNNAQSSECYCVEQMTNVIEQIARLYPDNQLLITLDSGDAVFGTAGEITLGLNGESGLFEVEISQINRRQLISICSIDSIRIDNATYNEEITYLPEPNPVPTDCKADCEATIREALPVGTTDANIITNGAIASQGNVIVNESGMIVLENPTNTNITFISTCRIDAIFLPNSSE